VNRVISFRDSSYLYERLEAPHGCAGASNATYNLAGALICMPLFAPSFAQRRL
jgi:hypothetical protein